MPALTGHHYTSSLQTRLFAGVQLASVGDRDAAFPLPHGRGDEFHHGSPTPDPRGLAPKGLRTRDIYVRDLHIDSIKVKTRDFR
ncbi:MAG: DNA polymerase [Brevundimonas sp. 67-6]|nr:MAG: DNA polymerase [Brevundimonas sp. 67-6]